MRHTNAHLTQYDTAHGRFPGTVKSVSTAVHLIVNGDRIKVLCRTAIRPKLPWARAGRGRGARVHGLLHHQGKGRRTSFPPAPRR
ncbi:MAG: hypothetical protein LKM39_09910 [Chiayiivirga sp.]|nr:hypothetical protein [Chiayiivirga sp.]